MKIEDLAVQVAPYFTPAFGVVLGLNWARNQSPLQRVPGFVGGFGLGGLFRPGRDRMACAWPKSNHRGDPGRYYGGSQGVQRRSAGLVPGVVAHPARRRIVSFTFTNGEIVVTLVVAYVIGWQLLHG
jgi:hypothetical protein